MNLCEELDSEVPQDKVVLVGNPGVGKSTIFQRFKTGRFVREEELMHHDKEGQEWQKVWKVGDEEVSITLFDTAGVERFTQTIPPTYYRRAKVVILVYSIDNNDSFQAISNNWLDNYASCHDEKSLTVLVGNKCDLKQRWEELDEFIPRKRALTLAGNCEIEMDMVFEISALTGKGFQAMLDDVAVRMREFMNPKPSRPSAAQGNSDSVTNQKNVCHC